MTGCDATLDLISLRLDGPLNPQDQRALDRHLAQCPSCRAIAADLCGLHSVTVGLGETPPPEGFAQGVLDRIAAEGTVPARDKVVFLHRRPAARRLAGLAACAILMLGAASVMRPELPEQAPPSAAPATAMPASSAPTAVEDFSAPALFGMEGGERTAGHSSTSGAVPRSQMEAGDQAQGETDYVVLVTAALGRQPNRVLVVDTSPDREIEWVELTPSISLCQVEPERMDALVQALGEEAYILRSTDSGGPDILLLIG